jgi:hypothetical protein
VVLWHQMMPNYKSQACSFWCHWLIENLRPFKQTVAHCDWPSVQAVLWFLLVRRSTDFDSCFRIVRISWFIYADGSLSVNNKQISLRFLSWIWCYIQL